MDGKSVLITGGTGSFGQKFTELLLHESRVKTLRIYSRDELKQHEMNRRLTDERLRFLIGDVRDKERLSRAMRGVDYVIHAAALKQVPTCEYNPFEAVKTNILGAENLIDVAIDCGVSRVMALSSDKAVNPVNLYGATKLCAEKLFVQGNAYVGSGGTRFSCARYGNVVGSRGSVIPTFLHQRTTGTVTVTDQRMTRFWITLEEGARFVLRCLETMHGGEIFVPKIPRMSIMDLVQAVAPACEVKVTGIRPGEKLHELLISTDEGRHTLEFEDHFVIQPLHPWWKVENWSDGVPLADGFTYASNTFPDQLSVDALRTMVAEQEIELEQRGGGPAAGVERESVEEEA
ncbi:MAG: UDP-N-acetylglucosamine 4,6-dehydratase (inverting) [Candidatus Omnitrophica bacterium]|nr:UDP-N-acetylglucosamine 4,6-dehydratase (inverting) [Candidatus Omnitrophota bacterium]